MSKVKKLYKSRTDSCISGVCGGLGEYLGICSTVIRLIWLICKIFYGKGLLLYIICAIVIPSEPEERQPNDMSTSCPKPNCNYNDDDEADYDEDDDGSDEDNVHDENDDVNDEDDDDKINGRYVDEDEHSDDDKNGRYVDVDF